MSPLCQLDADPARYTAMPAHSSGWPQRRSGIRERIRSPTPGISAPNKAASSSNTDVNPRYLPLSVPLVVSSQQGAVFYDLPYLEGSDSVTDRV